MHQLSALRGPHFARLPCRGSNRESRFQASAPHFTPARCRQDETPESNKGSHNKQTRSYSSFIREYRRKTELLQFAQDNLLLPAPQLAMHFRAIVNTLRTAQQTRLSSARWSGHTKLYLLHIVRQDWKGLERKLKKFLIVSSTSSKLSFLLNFREIWGGKHKTTSRDESFRKTKTCTSFRLHHPHPHSLLCIRRATVTCAQSLSLVTDSAVCCVAVIGRTLRVVRRSSPQLGSAHTDSVGLRRTTHTNQTFCMSKNFAGVLSTLFVKQKGTAFSSSDVRKTKQGFNLMLLSDVFAHCEKNI